MTFRVAPASYDATRHACRNWHYAGSVPAGKLISFGVWEDGSFRGVVVFSRGATPNIGKPYGLRQTEICELTRIALRSHRTPVSRVVRVALSLLRASNPGLRLVVSYADRDQGHAGKIYQAGGWVYEGCVCSGGRAGFIIRGRRVHPKTVHSRYGVGSQSERWLRAHVDPGAVEVRTKGKHKYLMPLDPAIREEIRKRAKPYPKE